MNAPEGVRIQKLMSGAAGTVREEAKTSDAQQVIEWHAEKAKALPAESQLPPEWVYRAGVGYFAGDAGVYYQELGEAMVAHASKRAQVEETAKQLTSAKTRLEAVRAIRDFIAKSIRDAGPSFTELPLSELSDADLTLSDGYGHGADRAILCYAMLAAAGFAPEFVLASDLPPIAGITKVTATFPLPETFQTPLVRVVVDGQAYYLNDTDQYARLGQRPTTVAPRWPSRLARWRPSTPRPIAAIRWTPCTIVAGGQRQDPHRDFAPVFRRRVQRPQPLFLGTPARRARRYFQEAVSGAAQGARRVSDLATQFEGYRASRNSPSRLTTTVWLMAAIVISASRLRLHSSRQAPTAARCHCSFRRGANPRSGPRSVAAGLQESRHRASD